MHHAAGTSEEDDEREQQGFLDSHLSGNPPPAMELRGRLESEPSSAH
jgi:hypothetical protein